MSKKGIGKFVAFAALAGAAVACVSYFTKYKSFHKELEEDFHDFEDEEAGGGEPLGATPNRNYVSLSSDKDEFTVAANDMKDAAKDMAGAAKEMLKDTAAIVSEAASGLASAAVDTAHAAIHSTKELVQEYASPDEDGEDAAGDMPTGYDVKEDFYEDCGCDDAEEETEADMEPGEEGDGSENSDPVKNTATITEEDTF